MLTDVFNMTALTLVVMAVLFSKGHRRLPMVILLNYGLYYALAMASQNYLAGRFFSYPTEIDWYLLNALREVIVMAFLFEGLMQRSPYQGWFKCYLAVISLSLLLNIAMAGQEMEANKVLAHIHLYYSYCIPFIEVIAAWLGSDNFLSQRWARKRLPVAG